MPIESILNYMQGPPAPQLLSEQMANEDAAIAQSYSTIRDNMLQSDMRQMALDQERKKVSLLENFNGDFESQDFYDAMMRVDPEMVIDMRYKLAQVGEKEREGIVTRAEMLAKMALADNTKDKWEARGWPIPWDEQKRMDIIMAGQTMQQAMSTESEMWSRENMKPSLSTAQVESARKMADQKASRGTPQWEREFNRALRKVAGVPGLIERSLEDQDLVSGEIPEGVPQISEEDRRRFKGAWE